MALFSRMNLNRLVVALGLTLVGATASLYSVAHADDALIREVEKLRDALPSKDLKGRQTLTIRLADLIYNESTKQSSNSDGTPAVERKITLMRTRSAQLYDEALSGQQGKTTAPVDPQRTTMEYRLSRVLMDLGQDKRAKGIWKNLIRKTEYPQVASESAMSLGELSEADNSAEGRKLAYECYDIAIQYGKDQDAVSYGHYRKAWLLRNDNKIAESIDELKASLYDSKGHVREEALKDLVAFTALDAATVTNATPYFQTLSEKLTRKELLQQLAEAYFASGHKAAGVQVLAEVNRKNPSITVQARLLEELYGQRKWNEFRQILTQLSDAPAMDVATEDGKAVEATLKRLGVQLDAERKTDATTTDDFVAVADLYLQLFPNSPLRFKMVEGSLAAEIEPTRKIARLEALLGNKKVAWKPEELSPMREQLVSLYQKQENHKGTAAVLALLIADAKSKEDVRRFKFVRASALFDMKQHDDAVALFGELVKENPYDKIGVKSQLSLVKMQGRDKKFDQVLASTEQWLPQAQAKVEGAEAADVKMIADIREEAEFEYAASLKKDPKALAIFKRFCQGSKFLPKSCENTRILALQLEDHPTYIGLLEKDGKKDEIAQYYEQIGMFADAAKAQEQQLVKASNGLQGKLKVALLYEIAGDTANNGRLLKAISKELTGKKFGSADEEDLIYLTLRDNGLMTSAALGLPWSEGRRCYLLNKFEEQGDSSDSARKQLLSCKAAPGPAWGKLVLQPAEQIFEKQSKINFHGVGSKKKFEQRLAAIKSLNQYIEKFYGPADAKTRVALATLGQKAYSGLADEVMKTPVPQMPTPEEDAAIKNQLAQMAAPFVDRTKEFDKLVADASKEEPQKAPEEAKLPTSVDLSAALAMYRLLGQEEKRHQALTDIHALYEKSGQIRIAAYFKGRLSQADSTPSAH